MKDLNEKQNQIKEYFNKFDQKTQKMIDQFVFKFLLPGKFLFNLKFKSLYKYLEAIRYEEKRVGYLSDSLISPTLIIPEEKSNIMSLKDAQAGEYLGFDPRRRSVFRPKCKNNSEGKLYALRIEELVEQGNKYDLTPTGKYNIYSVEGICSITTPTPEELLEWGFIEKVGLVDAYIRLGFRDEISDLIRRAEFKEKETYQVTPKGNGLIYTGKSGTQKNSKKDKILNPSFEPSFGWNTN